MPDNLRIVDGPDQMEFFISLALKKPINIVVAQSRSPYVVVLSYIQRDDHVNGWNFYGLCENIVDSNGSAVICQGQYLLNTKSGYMTLNHTSNKDQADEHAEKVLFLARWLWRTWTFDVGTWDDMLPSTRERWMKMANELILAGTDVRILAEALELCPFGHLAKWPCTKDACGVIMSKPEKEK